jgi:Flp pilus assembly protein TadG
MNKVLAYIREERAASAVEFALVIPVALALVLSLLHMSAVLYAANNLHFATEETARCLAVSANALAGSATATTACPSTAATDIQAYGVARYVGPNVSPTFTLGTTTACANSYQLSATGTYNMAMGFVSFPIAVSASACFPHS